LQNKQFEQLSGSLS